MNQPLPPLPDKGGVPPSFVWLPEGSWPDLLACLLQRFPDVSAESWLDRMARGEVVDDRGAALAPSGPARRGMRVWYYREIGPETPIPFEARILHRDEHLLVADKPHFLPVIPRGRFLHETLLVRLRRETGLADLVPIHRLDRETAGVVVFSHNRATRGVYQSMFQRREMEKRYEALAPLPERPLPAVYRSRIVPGDPFFVMREEAGPANSETWIDLAERRGAHALYRLRPVTGRQHQLRVHMAALGIPIVNDAFYPTALPCKGNDFSAPLQLLARSLAFVDPLDGRRREFFSNMRLLDRPSTGDV